MSRLINLFRKTRLDRQMDEEFQFHLDRLVEQLMSAGMTRERAMAEARRQFGSLEYVIGGDRLQQEDALGGPDSHISGVRRSASFHRPPCRMVWVLPLPT